MSIHAPPDLTDKEQAQLAPIVKRIETAKNEKELRKALNDALSSLDIHEDQNPEVDAFPDFREKVREYFGIDIEEIRNKFPSVQWNRSGGQFKIKH